MDSRNLLSWSCAHNQAFRSYHKNSIIHDLLQKVILPNKVNIPPTHIKSTHHLYQNIHHNRSFLESCDRQQAFIITSTHFLNRKGALASNSSHQNKENSEFQKQCGVDIEKYKKEVIRKARKNRQLQPHTKHSKLKYQGLRAIEMAGCKQSLLDELKNLSADPEKTSRRRILKFNFRSSRQSSGRYPSTPVERVADKQIA